MVEIRVPVERLREVAHSLENQAQDIDSQLQRTLSLVSELYSIWAGLAQIDYAQLCEEQLPPVRTRFTDLLSNLIAELCRIADVFEETDAQMVNGGSNMIVGGGAVGIAASGAAGSGNASSGKGDNANNVSNETTDNDDDNAGEAAESGSKPPGHASPPENTTPQISPGIHKAPVNPDAPIHDCVAYVGGQREVPSPILTWQNGGVDENWNYGDFPQPGAIMVEGYDPTIGVGAEINGTKWGHVSYVDWVEYNDAGIPVRFHIVEGSWEGGWHEQEFTWPIGNSSRRNPHRFVYDKK